MIEKMLTSLGIIGIALLIIGLFVVGPWLSILAINTLFGLSIPFNFWTWLSMFWLHIVFASSSGSK